MKVYLDNAASTPLDERVLEAMLPFLRHNYGNPSSVHAHGRDARAAIEKSRKKIAEILHASPSEIFFTSGGTEADNTALVGSIKSLGIKHAITSPLEHHAVLHTLKEYADNKWIRLSFLEVDEKGDLNYQQLEELLRNNPNSLVSIMHANNEIGNINDLELIGSLCREFGAFFHSDSVQTIGHYPIDLNRLPVDAMVGAGHKFHGPKGSGFLYVKKEKKIKPLIFGGAQERNLRGGTENLYGIVGITKALEIAHEEMHKNKSHIQLLKKLFIEGIRSKIPEIEFNGRSKELEKSLDTVLNLSLPPSDQNKGVLLFLLDLEGISLSGGSACSSGASLGSHVLRAINHSSEREAIRVSFSRFNTEDEIHYTLEKLIKLYSV